MQLSGRKDQGAFFRIRAHLCEHVRYHFNSFYSHVHCQTHIDRALSGDVPISGCFSTSDRLSSYNFLKSLGLASAIKKLGFSYVRIISKVAYRCNIDEFGCNAPSILTTLVMS